MIKIEIKQHININLPIGEVFAYMSTLENMTDWSGSTISIKQLSPGAMQVGATVRVTVRFLGKWLGIIFEVIEYRPDHCLTFKSVSGIVPCLLCYQFEPAREGGTTLSLEAVIHLTEGNQALVERVLRRQYECDLLTLKDLMEARAACKIADSTGTLST